MQSRAKLRRTLSTEKSVNAIDLTAMTDIIFILLIFFILTSNVAQNIFDFELPKADENFTSSKDLDAVNQAKITIFASGEYAIGEEKFRDYKKFKKAVKSIYKKNKNTEFLLISENTLPVENLMKIITFFQSEDITKVDILVTK